MLGGRAPRIAIAALTTLLLLSAPLADGASAAGHITFRCEMWILEPGSGGGYGCQGSANGVFASGSVVVCDPQCDFLMSIDAYGDTCLRDEPPQLGTYQGTMYLTEPTGRVWSWGYSAQRVANHVIFIFDGGPFRAGEGSWIPLPPLPTCAVPGFVQVLLVGRLY